MTRNPGGRAAPRARRPDRRRRAVASALALALSLSACSSIEDLYAGLGMADGEARDGWPALAEVPERPDDSAGDGERARLRERLMVDRADARMSSLWPNSPPPRLAAPPPSALAALPAPLPDAAPVPESAPESDSAAPAVGAAPAPAVAAPAPAPAPAPVPVPAVATAPVPVPVPETEVAAATPAPVAAPPALAPAETAAAPTAGIVLVPPAGSGAGDPLVLLAPAPEALAPVVPVGAFAAAPAGPLRFVLPAAEGRAGLARTIRFPRGSATVPEEDWLALAALAERAARSGATVRVVGHSSRRTREMDPIEHAMVNFGMSLRRANAVAAALVESGLPPDRLVVDAAGDTQPVASEAMPSGEARNRRAEIFVESS